jgi:hypothetical protein
MLWWAYSGFSGSIALSFASLAFLLGMPIDGVTNLTVTTLLSLLSFGLAVQLCADALAGRRKLPKRSGSPVVPLLGPLTHAAAAAPKAEPMPEPAPPPLAKRPSNALAGLRRPEPEPT